MNELSPIQSSVVDSLAGRGYHVNSVSSCEGDEFPTVFMSKRAKSYSTRYAEVDGTGLVNGQPLAAFNL